MAPQIGFHGLAPRSRAHLCFTIVEGSNRRREGGDVSRGFRVPRATALAGPDWFLRCKSVPNLAKNALPFTPALSQGVFRLLSNHPVTVAAAARMTGDHLKPLLSSTRLQNGVPAPAPAARRCCPNRAGALSGLWIPAAARMTGDRGFS